MDDLAGDTSGDSATATMDLEASAERVGAMLGEDLIGTRPEPSPSQAPENPEPVTPDPVATPPVVQAPAVYDMPKSWKADMRDHWGKMPRESQEYTIQREKQLLDGFSQFRPIQDALEPHKDFLARSNVSPAQAVGTLINAQRRLTEGTDDQRWGATLELIKHLGFEQRLAKLSGQQDPNATPAPQIDPAIQSVQQRLDAMEQRAQAEMQAKTQVIYEANLKKIEEFAADTTNHPYFDEVAEEVAILIKERGLSLQDAYPIAVRMNPTVWAKEEARLLTAHEAKLKENARLSSLPKRKAASVNIKSNGDGPEPTEPVGTIEDTIKRVAAKIKARA